MTRGSEIDKEEKEEIGGKQNCCSGDDSEVASNDSTTICMTMDHK
jgi:hypothetical protein